MKVNKDKLQEACKFALACSQRNKNFPITEMLGVEVDTTGELALFVTDSHICTAKVVVGRIEHSPVKVSVDITKFCKLIPMLQSDTLDIEIDDKSITVKQGKTSSSGTYKFEVIQDENGKVIYPKGRLNDVCSEKVLSTDVHNLNAIKRSCERALPKMNNYDAPPILSNYLLTENEVIASDSQEVIVLNEAHALTDLLIPARIMEILCQLPVSAEEKVELNRGGDLVKVTTPNVTLVYQVLEPLSNYPKAELLSYVDQEWPKYCKVNPDTLLNAINVVGIMSSSFDEDKLSFSFSESDITVTTTNGAAKQKVPIQEAENVAGYAFSISADTLKPTLRTKSEVELFLGCDGAIMLSHDNIYDVYALEEE